MENKITKDNQLKPIKKRKLTKIEFRKHVLYIWNITQKILGKNNIENFDDYLHNFKNTFLIDENNVLYDTSSNSLLTGDYSTVTNFVKLKYRNIEKINQAKLIRHFTLSDCRRWIIKNHISPYVYTEGSKKAKWTNLCELQQDIIDYNALSEYDEGKEVIDNFNK